MALGAGALLAHRINTAMLVVLKLQHCVNAVMVACGCCNADMLALQHWCAAAVTLACGCCNAALPLHPCTAHAPAPHLPLHHPCTTPAPPAPLLHPLYHSCTSCTTLALPAPLLHSLHQAKHPVLHSLHHTPQFFICNKFMLVI